MKDKLKDFFKNHMNNDTEKKETKHTGKEKKWITYTEWGFQKSAILNGNLLAFKGCLNLVKEHFLHEQGIDEVKRAKEVANAKVKIEQIDIEITNKISITDRLNSKIGQHKEGIDDLKKEIINIKENPTTIMKDRVSKLGFYIGLIILTLLTVYLFIFYSSASYSALFKNFTINDIGVANSIFDPKALQIAFETSWTEFALIILIPSIFLGLGYLIHKFQESEGIGKFFKIGTLVLITFVFDAILAYEITEKIYDIKKGGSFQEMPDYSIDLAMHSIVFWLIIFLGFIVYIIWGFVFDFVMEGYDKLDVVNQVIKAREKQISHHKEDIKKSENDIHKLQEEISMLNKDKVEQNKIVSGETILIDWAGFDKELLNFTSGWASWMTQSGIIKDKIDQIWLAREEFVKIHKKEKDNK